MGMKHLFKPFQKCWRDHSSLVFGGGLSGGLIVMLLVAKEYELDALDLKVQWIGLALLPLLLALIAGGYVKSFKGFGVELEARLRDPVTTVPMDSQMTAAKAASDIAPGMKGGRSQIEGLRSRAVGRLVFVQGKVGYYGHEAIKEYLGKLDSLRFLELQDKRGRFIALLPVELFVKDSLVDDDAVHGLIQGLEEGDANDRFREDAITVTIPESDSLIACLRKMREAQTDYAVVVSSGLEFIGLLETRAIEKRIADNVLATKRLAE